MRKHGGLSAKSLVYACIGIGIVALLICGFQYAKASPVKRTLNSIKMPQSTRQTIKQAEKEYLEIQKKDEEALKTFLANPKNYAIVSTPDPIVALDLYKIKNASSRILAGSSMVPLKGSEPQTFQRIYKVYYIIN